jgi:hypothetical protein
VATRLTRHLQWTDTQDASFAAKKKSLEAVGVDTTPPPSKDVYLDMNMAPRDKTIFYLHIGAEVEHCLMVQYLYAAYSLGGPHLKKAEYKKLAGKWKATILEIAREEMGHLATVENTLTVIGGPLSFEREDFPIPKDLYPFPFELEPLTRKSLGKYVLAEAPDPDTVEKLGLTAELEKIKKFVSGKGDLTVNRVGIIYTKIMELFAAPDPPKEPPTVPPEFVSSGDIQASSTRFQVSPDEWGLGYKDILIETSSDRASAIAGINQISIQGEGSDLKDLMQSHFGKFLEIYREFPAGDEWQPACNAARNPTTDCSAPPDRYISNDTARCWASFLNLRYRMLLMFLKHSFVVEAPLKGSGRTSRGLLVTWAFGEMYHIRSITEILMKLPLKAGGGDLLAGPPFEMPYSLSLATREANRWRGHRDLLMASQRYTDELLKITGDKYGDYLRGLQSSDNKALAQVHTLIGF